MQNHMSIYIYIYIYIFIYTYTHTPTHTKRLIYQAFSQEKVPKIRDWLQKMSMSIEKNCKCQTYVDVDGSSKCWPDMVDICIHPYLRYLVHCAADKRPRRPAYLCCKTSSTAWHTQARVRHAQRHAHTKGIQTKHSGNGTAAFACLGCYDVHRIWTVGFCLLHLRTHHWVVFACGALVFKNLHCLIVCLLL